MVLVSPVQCHIFLFDCRSKHILMLLCNLVHLQKTLAVFFLAAGRRVLCNFHGRDVLQRIRSCSVGLWFTNMCCRNSPLHRIVLSISSLRHDHRIFRTNDLSSLESRARGSNHKRQAWELRGDPYSSESKEVCQAANTVLLYDVIWVPRTWKLSYDCRKSDLPCSEQERALQQR